MVKRRFYVDDYSGERYPGRASGYLCDLLPSQTVQLAGPFGLPFEVPREKDANLVLVATSTGIAPFRAFVRHLHDEASGFAGRIRLFYGGRSGLDLVTLNETRNDFEKYYDDNTFRAFQALSSRPHWTDTIDWGATFGDQGKELWAMLENPRTYVYIAGLEKHQDDLQEALGAIAGDGQALARRRKDMSAGGRWVELLY